MGAYLETGEQRAKHFEGGVLTRIYNQVKFRHRRQFASACNAPELILSRSHDEERPRYERNGKNF